MAAACKTNPEEQPYHPPFHITDLHVRWRRGESTSQSCLPRQSVQKPLDYIQRLGLIWAFHKAVQMRVCEWRIESCRNHESITPHSEGSFELRLSVSELALLWMTMMHNCCMEQSNTNACPLLSSCLQLTERRKLLVWLNWQVWLFVDVVILWLRWK